MNGLLGKLKQIGLEDQCFQLFTSYLCNRKQRVVVDGEKSGISNLNSGIPQGSRLGPLLFIIYINDMINNWELDILLFADDTTILATGSDPNMTSAQLNRDLVKIDQWSQIWKVTFNAKKSKDMIFSPKFLNNSPPIIFGNVMIERVSSHKHLGIHLTNNLDWSTQVNEMCLKANRKLSVLRSVKFLSRKTLDVLYKLTVRSVIDYGLFIYFNSLKTTDKFRIEQIQYKAALVVTGALPYTSKTKLNLDLGWEAIDERAKFLGL